MNKVEMMLFRCLAASFLVMMISIDAAAAWRWGMRGLTDGGFAVLSFFSTGQG